MVVRCSASPARSSSPSINSRTRSGASVPSLSFGGPRSRRRRADGNGLLSCWNGKTPNDTQTGSFFIDTGTEGKAQPASVRVGIFPGNTHRGRLLIGRNMTKPGEELIGDVAEIMVFSHSFLVYEQVQAVRDYLTAKWGIVEERSDWTRTGPLPELPEHRTTDLPLSDQGNTARWRKVEAFCDDFAGDSLNEHVWWDCNPNWYGRAPARFLPENVAVRDGQLHLTFRRDDDLPTEVLYKANGAEYNTYSSASVVSKALFRYGYFEIKARPMNSAGSSAFWLSGSSLTDAGRHSLEIDVFEIGGNAKGHERNYGMNAHVFETPEDGRKHWSKGGKWVAPSRLADAFHVYGLEWGAETINYYFDGVLVRSLPNTHWHGPMFLIFDSESMFNWLGVPEDGDLPSTFSIEYCRVWTNPNMDTDWRKTYRPHRHPTKPTKISDYARSFRKKHPQE